MAEQFAVDADYRFEALGAGVRPEDKPLFVQFAATDPDVFASACAEARAMGADGADLNIGCPQRRAREGVYGSWMQEDWNLCAALIAAARARCPDEFAITAKIRVQRAAAPKSLPALRGLSTSSPRRRRDPRTRGRTEASPVSPRTLHVVAAAPPRPADSSPRRRRDPRTPRRYGACDQPSTENTVAFAKRLEAAGASLIALHARVRGSPERRRDGAADLTVVCALKAALRIPVLSNGNVRCRGDVAANLAFTGADGVMSAEQLLRDPALFDETSPAPAALVGEYLDLCAACESRALPREDGSKNGKDGAVTRSVTTGVERYSVWWPNIEVVRCHAKRMLEGLGTGRGSGLEILQRNTFRRAEEVARVDEYLRKRLRV